MMLPQHLRLGSLPDASGGCIHTRTQTAQRILRRAASIMLRRLDAVRERLAESSALESLLTARNS